MWYLQEVSDAADNNDPFGRRFYLFGPAGREFLVGRHPKKCDLVIESNTVSRQHAVVRVTSSKGPITGSRSGGTTVEVKDLRTTNRVHVNSVAIDPDVYHAVVFGDLVVFGNSKWRLQREPLVVTCTGMTSTEKSSLKDCIDFLGGELVSLWTSDITHVVTKNAKITAKTINALASNIPIVAPNFFTVFSQLNSRNTSHLLRFRRPVEKEFLPQEFSEEAYGVALERHLLLPDPSRRFLFASRNFRTDASVFEVVAPPIRFCGGSCTKLFPESPAASATGNSLMSRNVTVVCSTTQAMADSQSSSHNSAYLLDPDFKRIRDQLTRAQRRVIPENEIFLAILFCNDELLSNSAVPPPTEEMLTAEVNRLLTKRRQQSSAAISADPPASISQPEATEASTTSSTQSLAQTMSLASSPMAPPTRQPPLGEGHSTAPKRVRNGSPPAEKNPSPPAKRIHVEGSAEERDMMPAPISTVVLSNRSHPPLVGRGGSSTSGGYHHHLLDTSTSADTNLSISTPNSGDFRASQMSKGALNSTPASESRRGKASDDYRDLSVCVIPATPPGPSTSKRSQLSDKSKTWLDTSSKTWSEDLVRVSQAEDSDSDPEEVTAPSLPSLPSPLNQSATGPRTQLDSPSPSEQRTGRLMSKRRTKRVLQSFVQNKDAEEVTVLGCTSSLLSTANLTLHAPRGDAPDGHFAKKRRLDDSSVPEMTRALSVPQEAGGPSKEAAERPDEQRMLQALAKAQRGQTSRGRRDEKTLGRPGDSLTRKRKASKQSPWITPGKQELVLGDFVRVAATDDLSITVNEDEESSPAVDVAKELAKKESRDRKPNESVLDLAETLKNKLQVKARMVAKQGQPNKSTLPPLVYDQLNGLWLMGGSEGQLKHMG